MRTAGRHVGAEGSTVLVAHHHRILLESMASVLARQGYSVVGAAEESGQAVALASERRPDIAVLGSALRVMGGLDAARRILRNAPATAVLLLTGPGEHAVVQDALQAGVRGVVVEAQGVEDMLQAVRDVSQGAIYVSPLYSRTVFSVFARTPSHDGSRLTQRELEMLKLISDGKTMKQAATALGISARTAECHRAHIMQKLAIHDTAGLVRYAIRQGLIVA